MYIIIIFVVAFLVVLYLHSRNKKESTKALEKIKSTWGKPKTEDFNYDRIGAYALRTTDKPFHSLSDQTLKDIDFYTLFEFIDRTNSKVGQQVLFKKLLFPLHEEKPLIALNETVNELTRDVNRREQIQQELTRLNYRDAYQLTSLFQETLLKRPDWYRFLPLSVIAIPLLLLSSIFYKPLLLFLTIPVALNMFLHYWNKNNTFGFMRSFPQLNILIDVVENLITKKLIPVDPLLQESVTALLPFQQKMRLLGFSQGGSLQDDLSQIFSYFIELLKSIFLIEVFTIFELTRGLELQQKYIRALFDAAGELDTAVSVCSLRAGSAVCTPEFISPEKKISMMQVYHPRIANCAKNDLTISGKSILITGSNMSGKTTFLRTLIINSLLAQTVYTCFADQFQTPFLKQFSSIGIDDDLMQGKSYYFEEVNIIGSLVKASQTSDQNLFLLDEVFKGTNTVERIVSAKAVLSYLNRGNNIVVVSTHDIELSNMLTAEYDLYHFTDTIEDGKLHFDHIIKPGPLKTRNAIRLLELSNYPLEITSEAKSLIPKLFRDGVDPKNTT